MTQISETVSRLYSAKSSIYSAILQQSGTVSAGAGFEDFASAIMTIPRDPSGSCTATNNDLLSGKTAYASGALRVGNIPTRTSNNINIYYGSVSIARGYYSQSYTKMIPLGSLSAPSIISSRYSNKIELWPICSISQAGYLSATESIGSTISLFFSEIISGATATASTILYGYSAYGENGALYDGTAVNAAHWFEGSLTSTEERMLGQNITQLRDFAMAGAPIRGLELPICSKIGHSVFNWCYSMEVLKLPGSSIVSLMSSDAFDAMTANRFGIYVPSSLYSSYLTAVNWSRVSSSYFHAMPQMIDLMYGAGVDMPSCKIDPFMTWSEVFASVGNSSVVSFGNIQTIPVYDSSFISSITGYGTYCWDAIEAFEPQGILRLSGSIPITPSSYIYGINAASSYSFEQDNAYFFLDSTNCSILSAFATSSSGYYEGPSDWYDMANLTGRFSTSTCYGLYTDYEFVYMKISDEWGYDNTYVLFNNRGCTSRVLPTDNPRGRYWAYQAYIPLDPDFFEFPYRCMNCNALYNLNEASQYMFMCPMDQGTLMREDMVFPDTYYCSSCGSMAIARDASMYQYYCNNCGSRFAYTGWSCTEAYCTSCGILHTLQELNTGQSCKSCSGPLSGIEFSADVSSCYCLSCGHIYSIGDAYAHYCMCPRDWEYLRYAYH